MPVYSKENEPNDAMRQVVPQTMDGYPDQDFDSDSIGVISSTLDVYEAVATMSYREGLPKPTWVVMNYDDWRDNDVSDDQNLVIQQVALQTPFQPFGLCAPSYHQSEDDRPSRTFSALNIAFNIRERNFLSLSDIMTLGRSQSACNKALRRRIAQSSAE
jgi:hypothetical protein